MPIKRGITPLIATVILVGFAVVIVVLVMLWSSTYIKDIQEKQGGIAATRLTCATDISIAITNVQHTGNTLTITVENTNEAIDNFFVVIHGTEDQMTITTDETAAPGSITTLTATYDTRIGTINDVDIIPRIKVAEGIYESCSGQHEVYELS